MQPQEIAAISHEINLADTPEFQELYLKHMQFCLSLIHIYGAGTGRGMASFLYDGSDG